MENSDKNEAIDRECVRKTGEAAKRTGKPVFAGRCRRQSWRAELPLWVLWCAGCRLFTVTHPAGYGRISCRACRLNTHRVMTWQRLRDKRLKPFLHAFPRVMLPLVLIVLIWILSRS